MGNSKSTTTTSVTNSTISHKYPQLTTVTLHLKLLHNNGQIDIPVNRTATIGYLKKRWTYCDFNGTLIMDPQSIFSYTTGIGKNTKWIINNKVASDDLTLNYFLKRDQTDLNVVLMHKVGGNWIRYKCINCGYSGSLGHISNTKCNKCHYNFPSPKNVITNYRNSANTPSPTNTLQKLLQETHIILPTLISVLEQMCIPTNIIQCVISCCIGEIKKLPQNDMITFESKHIYHYALICNPFKHPKYEWIPTRVHQYSDQSQTIVLLNHSESDETEQIYTDYDHKYDSVTCSSNKCKDFAVLESEKECKIYIGCQVTHFKKSIGSVNQHKLQDDGKVEFGIKTLTGKLINARLDLNDSVLSLKQFVLDHEGIPVEQQRFISPFGRSMEDHKSLNHYGIMPGSPVYLVLRLRG